MLIAPLLVKVVIVPILWVFGRYKMPLALLVKVVMPEKVRLEVAETLIVVLLVKVVILASVVVDGRLRAVVPSVKVAADSVKLDQCFRLTVLSLVKVPLTAIVVLVEVDRLTVPSLSQLAMLIKLVEALLNVKVPSLLSSVVMPEIVTGEEVPKSMVLPLLLFKVLIEERVVKLGRLNSVEPLLVKVVTLEMLAIYGKFIVPLLVMAAKFVREVSLLIFKVPLTVERALVEPI